MAGGGVADAGCEGAPRLTRRQDPNRGLRQGRHTFRFLAGLYAAVVYRFRGFAVADNSGESGKT